VWGVQKGAERDNAWVGVLEMGVWWFGLCHDAQPMPPSLGSHGDMRAPGWCGSPSGTDGSEGHDESVRHAS